MYTYLDKWQQVVDARPTAVSLADALSALLDAKEELRVALSKVPDYTGQHDPRDFTATEQEAYNRAVEAYEDAVINSVETKGWCNAGS